MITDTEIETACPNCAVPLYVPIYDLVHCPNGERECYHCGHEAYNEQLSEQVNSAALLRALLELYENLPRLIREHSTT